MTTEAEKKAIKKYHEKFDTVVVRVPKGEKKIIAEHAAGRRESVMFFIRRANKEIERRSEYANGCSKKGQQKI